MIILSVIKGGSARIWNTQTTDCLTISKNSAEGTQFKLIVSGDQKMESRSNDLDLEIPLFTIQN